MRARSSPRASPITAEALLVAAGRTPNLESLDLEAAGVGFDEHGVKTNDYLQTSQPHIYAAGDITNRLKFTHTADATARVVVRNILMPLQLLRQKMDLNVVPWCTYTDPEVAHVGLGRNGREKTSRSPTISSACRWTNSIARSWKAKRPAS